MSAGICVPQWDDMEIERTSNEDGDLEFSGITLRFNIIGLRDAEAADELLKNTAPNTINELVIDTMEISRLADKAFEGVVKYKKDDEAEDDEDSGGDSGLSNLQDSEFSFDTTGGTQHITQSYSTTVVCNFLKLVLPDVSSFHTIDCGLLSICFQEEELCVRQGKIIPLFTMKSIPFSAKASKVFLSANITAQNAHRRSSSRFCSSPPA